MSRLAFPALRLTCIAAVSVLFALPCLADSQIRIVRLSNVEGKVLVDRGAGQGFEKAFLNLPITQGMSLRTDIDGATEIELEDGSTIRVTPGTQMSFPRLALLDSGAKASTIHVQEGTVYVSSAGTKDDRLAVTFGHQALNFTNAAHVRIEMEDATALVSVFKGDVEATGGKAPLQIAAKHSASFDLLGEQEAKVEKNTSPDPYDSWDKQQQQYHDRYASASYNSFSPFAYGSSDLNYYGSFNNISGCGMCWQPYFAGAGWDPFMNGAWSLYPGLGYSWVSAYPWGWTPYHSGTWMYLTGGGWAWQPGSTWYGATGFVPVVNAPSGFHPPAAPALAPLKAPANTIVVNRGPIPTLSTGFFGNKLSIPANSAGLGVPRGGIANLGSLSPAALQRGSISTSSHYTPAAAFGGWGSLGGASSSSVRPGTSFTGFSSGLHGSSSHPSTASHH